jgi:septal ring factor EnvC (AmiA/AmiB activator)
MISVKFKIWIPKSLRLNNFIIVLIFLMTSVISTAQSRQNLEKERIKLQKEIKEINSLLFKSQVKEKNLLSDLSDLNKRIRVRTRLIETIHKETQQISKEIKENQKEVDQLENRLKALKKDYANMVVKSYKSKTKQSRLMFLLSSKDFLQAYKRMQYIKQYNDYREKQGEEIKTETVKLQNLNNYLKETKAEKEALLLTNTKEKDSIHKEKKSRESLVRSVKKKEKKYTAQIRKKQKAEKAIDKKIEKLIRDAIARSKKKNNKKNLKSTGFALTPEAKKLEKDFLSNKGKLPSPVKRGVVVRHFGKQPHPTLKGITIESNGVFYATEKGASARVIFNGKVLAIQVLPGKKKAVLVQHGNYISVYKNLDNVTVKKGDIVKTKQEIGIIHTDKTTGKTILAFVLFKEVQRQNPELWVYKI